MRHAISITVLCVVAALWSAATAQGGVTVQLDDALGYPAWWSGDHVVTIVRAHGEITIRCGRLYLAKTSLPHTVLHAGRELRGACLRSAADFGRLLEAGEFERVSGWRIGLATGHPSDADLVQWRAHGLLAIQARGPADQDVSAGILVLSLADQTGLRDPREVFGPETRPLFGWLAGEPAVGSRLDRDAWASGVSFASLWDGAESSCGAVADPESAGLFAGLGLRRKAPEPISVLVWAFLGLTWAGLRMLRRPENAGLGRGIGDRMRRPRRQRWSSETRAAIRKIIESGASH